VKGLADVTFLPRLKTLIYTKSVVGVAIGAQTAGI
jgi:hypothetical protein